jgi:hypothetical protein
MSSNSTRGLRGAPPLMLSVGQESAGHFVEQVSAAESARLPSERSSKISGRGDAVADKPVRFLSGAPADAAPFGCGSGASPTDTSKPNNRFDPSQGILNDREQQ